MQADITKARRILGWEPRVSFKELVKIMVDYDLLALNLPPRGEGLRICKLKGFGYTEHQDFERERCVNEIGF